MSGVLTLASPLPRALFLLAVRLSRPASLISPGHLGWCESPRLGVRRLSVRLCGGAGGRLGEPPSCSNADR